MKNLFILLIIIGFSIAGFTDYTYTITEGYVDQPSLDNDESLLVTGGGTASFQMNDNSYANIQGTSTLGQGTGGIWQILLVDNSHVDFSGGQIHELAFNHDATAILSGGLIQRISSYQSAWEYDQSDPPQLVPNPHITMVCNLDYNYDTQTQLLTGTWLDATSFSIQLVNVQGYDLVIENIQFIPEPVSIAFLALGGLLIHKRK